tara:strand:+ start:1104 stop:2042 length:939 start_codon:yes stop_codon:yes gene_type:complete
MVLLRRKSVFAAKTEGTVGTAEALTGAEGVYNARDFTIQPSIGMTRREGQGGFNYLAGIPEGMQGTCTIVHDLAYDGTALPAWASVLLPACGWVVNGGTAPFIFSPKTEGPGTNVKTLTIGHYKDGKFSVLSGAMGTFVVTLETGKIGYITFTFTGKYSANETDVALIAPTYPTTLPMRFAVGAFSFNSVALCTSSATVDAGNSVVMRECVSATDRSGYISALVTNRLPVITADPESVLVATQDLDAAWLGSLPYALSITVGSVGSSIVFAAPKAQLENKQQGNRNDMLTDDLTWLATTGAAVDSELTITFD